MEQLPKINQRHEDLLMPKEELAMQQPPEVGHILRIRMGNGALLLVMMGVQHRNELLDEPEDRTLYRIGAMRQEWDDFNDQTSDTPSARLAIHEGGPRITLPNETELQTYQRGGEPTLLTRWAKEGDKNGHEIDITSGEPPLGSEVSHLLRRGHPPDAIWLHYYIRDYISWASRDPQSDPTEYAGVIAKRYEDFLSDYPAFEGFDFSLENVGAIHRRYYNWDEWRFDPTAPDFHEQATATDFVPTLAAARHCYGNHIIQQVAYDCQAARDYHLLTLFERQLKLGRKIFSLFGWPHAYALTPTIEYLQEQVDSPDFWTPRKQSPLLEKETIEKHRLEYVQDGADYARSEARELDEVVSEKSRKTVLIDYDFLASLYYETWQNEHRYNLTPDDQQLYQRAADELSRYNRNYLLLDDSFGEEHCSRFLGAVQKVRVNQGAIVELNKHTRYDLPLDGTEYILPTIRLEYFFPEGQASSEVLNFTTSLVDVENQTMTAPQYIEACMRWIGYEPNWLPFDSQLFTAVQNSPDIIQIINRLEDPQFTRVLEQFLHQAVDYYQRRGERLKLKNGNVVFIQDENGEYTYRVSNEFGRKALDFYNQPHRFNDYLIKPGSYEDKSSHREFLEQCNYKRTIQGLLAAVNSPLYRSLTVPPLWPDRPDKLSRLHWANIFGTTKRLFSNEDRL